jgi:hypothetical protein
MVKKDVNLSCVSSIDVDEPHSFMDVLNGENSQIGKRPWILSFNFYRIIRFGYLLLFHIIANMSLTNAYSKSNIMSLAIWYGTWLVWWLGDLHKLKVLISMEHFPLVHECNQFELCLQL